MTLWTSSVCLVYIIIIIFLRQFYICQVQYGSCVSPIPISLPLCWLPRPRRGGFPNGKNRSLFPACCPNACRTAFPRTPLSILFHGWLTTSSSFPCGGEKIFSRSVPVRLLIFCQFSRLALPRRCCPLLAMCDPLSVLPIFIAHRGFCFLFWRGALPSARDLKMFYMSPAHKLPCFVCPLSIFSRKL